MRKIIASAAALCAMGAVALATPAYANSGNGNGNGNDPVTQPPAGSCSGAPLYPAATACVGYFTGNVFDNSSTDVQTQDAALTALVGTNTTVDFDALSKAGDVIGNAHGDATALNNLLNTVTGPFVIGLHWGNVPDGNPGVYGNVSGFYYYSDTPGSSVTLNPADGFSDAVLYKLSASVPAVPEPATWAMMLMGFGGIGMAMSRRRRAGAALMQLA